MTRNAFEQQVLRLWMTSQVPLTRANLSFYTELDRAQLERWLDELVGAGVLEVDSDDAGELIWTVVGAARPAHGTTSVADVKKLDSLKQEVAPSRALVRRPAVDAFVAKVHPSDGKSLVASGALSFFFGPLGWLYAAPLKEALPAVMVYLIIMMLLPHALLAPLLGVFAPLSALTGILYAWRHNQRGERTSLIEEVRRLPPRR
jgi:hypothetical protein